MIHIDGSQGEGGGQILRTALALSVITQQPVTVDHVRAHRSKPGLARQHLTAVLATAAICDGEVEGAVLRSTRVTLRPGRLAPGEHRFDIGTAGSANLVLQTVLPPLSLADAPSTVTVQGGTHNEKAPSTDWLQRVYAPALARFGPRLVLELARHGFHPRGGGVVRARVEPVDRYTPADFERRSALSSLVPEVILAKLPERVADVELTVLRHGLGLPADAGTVRRPDTLGPGNVAQIVATWADGAMIFTGFGSRGRPAEHVADAALAEARPWLATDVPVDAHLADQLLLPMALAGGGTFRTTRPTLHTTTSIDVIRRFLDVQVVTAPEEGDVWRVTVGAGPR